MHPTINEQLTGAKRLLELAETESELTAVSAEALANVRRLLTQVQRSWSTLLPFYVGDNARLAELLTQAGRTVEDASTLRPDDVVAHADRNTTLREELSHVIAALSAPADHGLQAAITEYLIARVAADPS